MAPRKGTVWVRVWCRAVLSWGPCQRGGHLPQTQHQLGPTAAGGGDDTWPCEDLALGATLCPSGEGPWQPCEVVSLPVSRLAALLSPALPGWGAEGGAQGLGSVVLQPGWGWWGAHWDPAP